MFGRSPFSALASALEKYVAVRREELAWLRSHAITKQDLKQLEDRLMSKISESAAGTDAALARIEKGITGLVKDVLKLNKRIDDLQNTAGEITPEDQKILDDIQARATDLATKLEALDAATEEDPEAPPV